MGCGCFGMRWSIFGLKPSATEIGKPQEKWTDGEQNGPKKYRAPRSSQGIIIKTDNAVIVHHRQGLTIWRELALAGLIQATKQTALRDFQDSDLIDRVCAFGWQKPGKRWSRLAPYLCNKHCHCPAIRG